MEALLSLFKSDIGFPLTYDFLNQPLLKDGLRLATIQDIAAMKLSAITGRGSRKDFIDLYFILNQFNLSQLFEFYKTKFPDGTDFLVYKSLSYFDDAELEPMPNMIAPLNWEVVKLRIIQELKIHFP